MIDTRGKALRRTKGRERISHIAQKEPSVSLLKKKWLLLVFTESNNGMRIITASMFLAPIPATKEKEGFTRKEPNTRRVMNSSSGIMTFTLPFQATSPN